MRAKFIFEKFTQDSDPIKDLGIGQGTLHNLKRGDIIKVKYNFTIDKNKKLVPVFKLMTYIKPALPWIKGGLYLIIYNAHYENNKVFITGFIGSDDLNVAKERRDVIFVRYADFPPPIPKGEFWTFEEDIDKKFEFVKDNEQIKESLNEKFTQNSDPIRDMHIGYPERQLNTKSWKVLKFIQSAGEDGVSLKEIQYFIWTKLKGYTDADFWKKDMKYAERGAYYATYPQRASRGYWNTNLLGNYRQPGILHKYCQKNDKGKWIIKRMPKPYEKMYDFEH